MGAAREERRGVTALFADLVGSTELVRQLDPEDVRLVVGEASWGIAGFGVRVGLARARC